MGNHVTITDGRGAHYTSSNPVPVRVTGTDGEFIASFVDTNNDTDTPLLSGQTFTGQATDITNYSAIGLMVYSDVNSANDGLRVEFSFDGSDWHEGEMYTIPAGVTKFFTPPKQGKYYRVLYTNNGDDQTEFHIHSLVSVYPTKWSSHNLKDTLNDDDDAELNISVLKLRTAQDNYVSGSATNNGNFKTSLEELESGISTNNNSQLNVSQYLVDEYGNYSHVIGDNIFRGSPINIQSEHHEIHCGDSYTSSNCQDLANGATYDYLITVPNWGTVDGTNSGDNQGIKIAHLVSEIIGESETSVYLYEAPIVTNTGTSMSVLNRNRNSNNVDYLSISKGATVSATGTLLEYTTFGSGIKIGGSSNRTDEWVLRNNTTYLFRVINNTTTNNYHCVRFQYYVHPGI